MKYSIRGENVEITDSIRKYIEEKIDKLNKYFDSSDSFNANVVIKVRGKGQKMEITIPIPPTTTIRLSTILTATIWT